MKNTWTGWIIDESLKDASILSELKVLKVQTEENEEGDEKRTWKLYTVEIEDNKIDEISKVLEYKIKPEYYIHFTNGKNLLIIFCNKSFIIRLKKAGEDKGFGITSFEVDPSDKALWKSALGYGTKEGRVDPRYIIEVK